MLGLVDRAEVERGRLRKGFVFGGTARPLVARLIVVPLNGGGIDSGGFRCVSRAAFSPTGRGD